MNSSCAARLRVASMGAALLCFALLNVPAHAQSASPYTYQIDIVGGSIAQQGTIVPITLYNQWLTGTPADGDRVALRFTDAASGQQLPYGGVDYVCPQPPGLNNTQCTGTYPNYALGGTTMGTIDGYLTGAAPMWMNLIIAPDAVPGPHTILISGSDFNGITASTSWTINVVSAAQLAIPQTPLAAAVPVPARARWESDMTLWAAKWCPTINPQNFNTYLYESIMFYDGARVYYQIGDYTKDPGWAACAHQLASDYYPYISSGQFFGLSMFPQGLMMDAQRTGQQSSYAGVSVLAQTSSWSYGNPEYMTDPTSLREDAFGLEALLDDQALNGTSYPLLQQAESALIGALDQIFVQKRFTWYQPFMVGLAAEALIQYNEQYPDPRIPWILKQSLDSMWATAWRADLHGFYYRCYALNLAGLPADLPASNHGCFDPDVSPGNPDSYAYPWTPGDTFDYNDGQPNLNNLISPAYAWMYLQTGDTQYRQQADAIFADGVLYNGAINWAGKEFSQNYRWSFDYIKWRDQANSQSTGLVASIAATGTAPADTEPPVVSIVAPVTGVTVGTTMSLIADASDNVYVTGVQFQADGVNLGPAVVSLPFEQINIPTFLLSNGSHNITAIAYDAAGNSTTSAPITITVNNPVNASIAECPSDSIPTGVFQGCYYQYYNGNMWIDVYGSNASNPPPVPTLGTLITTRTDAAIDFDWGTGDPAPGVIEWNSTEVWQSKQMFNAGTYTFTASVDGNTGIRVYVDGQMVRNQWNPNCGLDMVRNNCPESFTVSFLESSLRLLRVETWHYYSENGLYSVHLSWTPAGAIAQPVVSAVLTASAGISAGEPVTLTWTSTNSANIDPRIPNVINNSTGCFGTNFDAGMYADPANSTTVNPTSTTTYSLTCYGPAGSATAHTTVVVGRDRHRD